MIDDRDYVGYGGRPPQAAWPGGARVALNINLNVEGGGERSVLDGDGESEGLLNDIGQPSLPGLRSVLVESVFEYGSRVGAWRLLDLFRAFEVLTRIAGERPVGWMTGRPSASTRRLIVEAGGLLYDRDALNDELPYWRGVAGRPHLVIPYSFETNDNRFDGNVGFSTADDFARYMIDCFEELHAEGARCPRLMSLAVHDRLIGRPGRIAGLRRFLEHVRGREGVWIATGREIAEHWRRVHPFDGG
jgi:peptidoglycan/xylan/chitin deacetylase (PgdA/CDA1 family)